METTDLITSKQSSRNSVNASTNEQIIKWGLEVIEIEQKTIGNLTNCVDDSFALACKFILECHGKVIVIGMGKSGHVANKIAATLSSTGTPSFFIHPAEAIHGDLGMISQKDVVIALSHSGETNELLNIIPHIKRKGTKLISISGNKNSTLAKYSDCNLETKVEKEACSLGLAPTSSTTAAMVMGDAIAISLLNARGFSAEDFAKNHPGGKLGRNLLVRIKDIMHSEDKIPKVTQNITVADALKEISAKRLGMTTVVDSKTKDKLLGIFTDGDLRRLLGKGLDVHKTLIKDVMTHVAIYVSSDMLGAKALQLMEKHKILVMPVIDNNKLVGAFNMHDLFKAGVV